VLRLVAETLDVWRLAARVAGELPVGDPRGVELDALVLRLRDLYGWLTRGTPVVTPETEEAARALIAEAVTCARGGGVEPG
jgi:hypothetical protein